MGGMFDFEFEAKDFGQYENWWFFGLFCPFFGDTDQKMPRSSIFDADSLFSFIMTQIFERKKNIFI